MTTGGELKMLNSDVDAFGNDSIANLLVDDDSDGARVDVENASSAAMIVFIGHAFVDGSIDCDVHNISDFIGGESLGNVDGTVLLESFSELMSGSPFVSVAVSHLWLKIII